MDVAKTPCDVCGGKRFKDEVLAFKLNGKSIADVLAMTVAEALEFFEIKEVVKRLEAIESLEDLVELFIAAGKKGIAINRYKGLGEMNPDTLWTTTMDPENRTLLQVRLDFVGVVPPVEVEPDLEGRRNLVSVWRLLRQGDWLTVERARRAGQRRWGGRSYRYSRARKGGGTRR